VAAFLNFPNQMFVMVEQAVSAASIQNSDQSVKNLHE
jgi:hypothetical protein